MRCKILVRSRSKNKTSKRARSIFTRIREALSFNIGTIVFGAVFLYMVISVILYLTSEHISTYQVTAGPLAKNQTYIGLAVRSEEIVYSNTGGYITYYAKDNAKVKNSGIVYGVGETPAEESSVSISDSLLESLRQDMSSFSSGFETDDYNEIYRFKYKMEESLIQANSIVLPSQSMGNENITVGNQTVSTAISDGIVLYSMDGYENFDVDSITKDTFNTKNYQLQSLKTKDRVDAGAPIYRIITDETWSVYIPLTDKQVIDLADRSSIRVKFLKDNVTQMADIVIHTSSEGTYYGELKFVNGVIRYSSDRFIELELVTNTTSGLKIPVTSIVNKSFYTIPVSFGIKGGDSDDIGFLIQKKSDADNDIPQVYHLTIYEDRNDFYYLDPNDIEAGDIVIQEETNKRYIIGDTETLEGVYCINKGYAVFRKIEIIDKNDAYCIVNTNTKYGLSQFDHIVEDSSTVQEQEILY